MESGEESGLEAGESGRRGRRGRRGVSGGGWWAVTMVTCYRFGVVTGRRWGGSEGGREGGREGLEFAGRGRVG